jgi:hypothetical protein
MTSSRSLPSLQRRRSNRRLAHERSSRKEPTTLRWGPMTWSRPRVRLASSAESERGPAIKAVAQVPFGEIKPLRGAVRLCHKREPGCDGRVRLSRRAGGWPSLSVAGGQASRLAARTIFRFPFCVTSALLTDFRPFALRRYKDAVESLDVVVEIKLPRVRPKPDRVDLVLALIGHPGLQEVVGEDPTGLQELVVCLKRGQ